ncbi:MAG: helix-turn-helix transcriptional regulator [Gammaproteobacteria bacterium]|nr:helix-turn-helix transcriptional regulator [Gammaproteobacteria bacterium]MYL00293.1 helix-turn-helix transcriptional regulator [Gammaproteobacteria bacterium]
MRCSLEAMPRDSGRWPSRRVVQLALANRTLRKCPPQPRRGGFLRASGQHEPEHGEDRTHGKRVTGSHGGIQPDILTSELSRRAKVDRVALSRALSGRRHPRLDTLAKVADACGVKLQFSA